MYVQIIKSSLVYSCLYPKCMFYPHKKLYCQSKFCFNYLFIEKMHKVQQFFGYWGDYRKSFTLYIPKL